MSLKVKLLCLLLGFGHKRDYQLHHSTSSNGWGVPRKQELCYTQPARKILHEWTVEAQRKVVTAERQICSGEGGTVGVVSAQCGNLRVFANIWILFSNAGYKNRRQYGKSPKNQLSVVLPIFYQSTQEHELNRAMVLATLYFQSASDKCSLSWVKLVDFALWGVNQPLNHSHTSQPSCD